jgi:hypothetical protein
MVETPLLEQRHEDVIQQQEKQAGLQTSPQTFKSLDLPSTTELKIDPLVEQRKEIEPSVAPLKQVQLQTDLASLGNLDVKVPKDFNPSSVDPSVVTDIDSAQAAQGTLSQQIDLSKAQGIVSPESIAQAQTEELDPRGTVSFQLGELYKSIEEGKPFPPWAAGPIRAASGIMQARGLGKSSMAAAAIVQAVQEGALPIAASDAQAFSRIQLQNLSNKQQTTLFNAANFAAMDIANLNARMTALVENSKSFLALDLSNLNNRQVTEQLNYQGRLQKLFSNQAAENAAKQFNAASTNQVNQFFAKLSSEVETNNANRLAATDQFNIDQVNSMSRYQEFINDSRDKFYENMQREINQSNVLWRRTINTANTAAQNAANQVNAKALLDLTFDAQNKMWQQYRDEATFLMQQSENNKQRAHNAAMLASQNDFTIDRYNQSVKDGFWSQVGAAVIGGLF